MLRTPFGGWRVQCQGLWWPCEAIWGKPNSFTPAMCKAVKPVTAKIVRPGVFLFWDMGWL